MGSVIFCTWRVWLKRPGWEQQAHLDLIYTKKTETQLRIKEWTDEKNTFFKGKICFSTQARRFDQQLTRSSVTFFYQTAVKLLDSWPSFLAVVKGQFFIILTHFLYRGMRNMQTPNIRFGDDAPSTTEQSQYQIRRRGGVAEWLSDAQQKLL